MLKAGTIDCIFYSPRVPVLQNKVYEDAAAAKHAPSGSLNIRLDHASAFAFNADFREELVTYDQDYDNSVPSDTFLNYYDAIAAHIVSHYDLARGLVIDIGCGKGTFLTRLATRYQFVTGLGIDPAYEGCDTLCNGRVRFIREYFSPAHIRTHECPAIVMCRHTLDQTPCPVDFLKNISEPFRATPDVPLFIEVPNLAWIIENRSFWDFCYEHVSCFTPGSLAGCVAQAGASVTRMSPAFGGQYIWAEARMTPRAGGNTQPSNTLTRLSGDLPATLTPNYFNEHVELVLERIKRLSGSRRIVIWGMSTKGVMYSLHLLNRGFTVDHCVDINKRKQGKYCPVSGLPILPPEALRTDADYAIICMNPNYAPEIRAQCSQFGLRSILFSPAVDEI